MDEAVHKKNGWIILVDVFIVALWVLLIVLICSGFATLIASYFKPDYDYSFYDDAIIGYQVGKFFIFALAAGLLFAITTKPLKKAIKEIDEAYKLAVETRQRSVALAADVAQIAKTLREVKELLEDAGDEVEDEAGEEAQTAASE